MKREATTNYFYHNCSGIMNNYIISSHIEKRLRKTEIAVMRLFYYNIPKHVDIFKIFC